jgi:hypothetical protein
MGEEFKAFSVTLHEEISGWFERGLTPSSEESRGRVVRE